MDRNEAIKIVRMCCPKITDSKCDFETAMRVLVPELKESEDERIRKEIIQFLRDYHFDRLSIKVHIDTLELWAAWLEKQGEKVNIQTVNEVWKDIRLEVGAQASGNRHEPQYSDNSTKLFSLNDIDEIIEKISEKQGEQKCFLSKDEEYTLARIIERLEDDGCPSDWLTLLNDIYSMPYQHKEING